MKVKVQTLDAAESGDIELKDEVFGVEPRADEGRADHDIVTLAMRQHIADFHDVADFAGDLLDLQHIIGGDAILLAARFDDCEHFLPFAVRSAL